MEIHNYLLLEFVWKHKNKDTHITISDEYEWKLIPISVVYSPAQTVLLCAFISELI